MKVTIAVIFVLTFFAATLSLPAPRRNEVEIIPLEGDPFGTQPIVDTGVVGGWNNPFPNSFGNIFENLEGIMTRMRQQLETIMKRFPLNRSNSSVEVPEFSFPSGLDPIPNIGDLDLGKGNSTSVTKIIDGHKVVINETEYKNEGDFGGTFFKVRIIDVKSNEGITTTEKDTEDVPVTTEHTIVNPEKDRESVENSLENEIPKDTKEALNISKKNQDQSVEVFDEIDASSPFGKINPNAMSFRYEVPTMDNQYFVPIQDRASTQRQNNRQPAVLLGSTNQQANTGWNSNAESLEMNSGNTNSQGTEWDIKPESLETNPASSVPQGSSTGAQNFDDEWSNIESLDTFDDNTLNSGENFNNKPIDLSRDTYINQVLAEAGAPTNPDAEVFFVPQQARNDRSPIRFEKFINPR